MSAGAGGKFVAGEANIIIGADTSGVTAALAGLQNSMNNLGRQAQALGMEFLKLGGLIVAPFALATKTFVEFDDQMRQVKAVTGAAGEEFEALTARARQLGKDTSFTAQEAAEGLTLLGRAGFSAKESIAGIGNVLDVARAGALDLGRAAEVVGDLSRAFGISADEIDRVGDVLIATANNSSTSVELLSNSFRFVQATASVAGQSIEDTSKALGILADRGLKGSLAGTSLNQALVALADTKVTDRIEGFGVSVTTATGEIRPMVSILTELGKATKRLPPADKIGLFKELFGLRGFRSALTIAEASAESIAKVSGAIDASNGVAGETAKTIDEGLGGSLRILNSAFQDLQITVGEALEGTLKGAVDNLKDMTNAAAEWVKVNQDLVVGIAKFGAVLVGLGAGLIVIGTLAKGFALLLSPIALVAGAILLLLDAFDVVNIGFDEMVGNFRVGGSKIQSWFAGLYIALLVGWEKVKGALADGWLVIEAIGTEASNALAESLVSAADIMLNAFLGAVNGIADGINYLVGLANQALDALGSETRLGEVVIRGDVVKSVEELKGILKGANDVIVADSTAAWAKVESERTKRAEETTKRVAQLNAAMVETFQKDAKDAAKETVSGESGLEEKIAALKDLATEANFEELQKRLAGITAVDPAALGGATAGIGTKAPKGAEVSAFFAGGRDIAATLSTQTSPAVAEQKRTNGILQQSLDVQQQTLTAVSGGARAT